MSTVTISIDSSDFPFVIEAIRARSNALLGAVTAQVTSQLTPPHQAVTITASAPVPTQVSETVVVPKKAAKAAKPADENAPWGYKKDGTPRSKPGRKT